MQAGPTDERIKDQITHRLHWSSGLHYFLWVTWFWFTFCWFLTFYALVNTSFPGRLSSLISIFIHTPTVLRVFYCAKCMCITVPLDSMNGLHSMIRTCLSEVKAVGLLKPKHCISGYLTQSQAANWLLER